MEQHHASLKQLAPPKTYKSEFAKSHALAKPPAAGTPWLQALECAEKARLEDLFDAGLVLVRSPGILQ